MSITIPPRINGPNGYDPAASGCTAEGCSTQDTVTLCSTYGRRCRAHSPWMELVSQGEARAAFASLLAWLHYQARTA